MSNQYWLISAPSNNGEMFSELQKHTGAFSTVSKLNLPQLRAGTLDSLMTLSDDLVKHDQQVEAVLRKLERQMVDLGTSKFTVSVDKSAVSTDNFVTDFKWASNKFQEKLALTEISGKIHSEVSKIDDELRNKQTEFNGLRSSLQQVQRKQTGNLAVRNLGSLGLNPSDFIDTENFTTVLVVVPTMESKEWLKTYETGIMEKEESLGFSPILANSSKNVYKDSENGLWTVTVFRRKMQDFKLAMRDTNARWAVREFEYNEESISQEKEELEAMEGKAAKAQKTMLTWCNAMYGEVFRALMHLKAIRLFVESVLRYGVPPDFQGVVMKPKGTKYEKKLQAALMKQFRSLGSDALYSSNDDALPPGMAAQDFFPYVFLTMDVTTSA